MTNVSFKVARTKKKREGGENNPSAQLCLMPPTLSLSLSLSVSLLRHASFSFSFRRNCWLLLQKTFADSDWYAEWTPKIDSGSRHLFPSRRR